MKYTMICEIAQPTGWIRYQEPVDRACYRSWQKGTDEWRHSIPTQVDVIAVVDIIREAR